MDSKEMPNAPVCGRSVLARKGRFVNRFLLVVDTAVLFLSALAVLGCDPKWVYPFHRGLAWEREGDYDRAISEYDHGIAIDGSVPRLYAARGEAWLKKGICDRAIEDFSRVIELRPNFWIYYLHRSLCYEKKGLETKALADLETINRLDPHWTFVQLLHYGRKYDLAMARADVERLIELEPGHLENRR